MSILITKDNEILFKNQKDLSMRILNNKITELVEREIRKHFDTAFQDSTMEAAIEAANFYCLSDLAGEMKSDMEAVIAAQKGIAA